MVTFVIGSGPAGAAAAAALVKRGAPVAMLDAGGELEPEIRAQVDDLARRGPQAWSPAEREAVRGPLRYNSEGAPLKLLFGSDFPYRDVDRLEPTSGAGVDAYRAFALGGLSTLWGAAVLPYGDDDLAGWPMRAANLREGYAEALALTGLSANRDDLEALFPLHVEPSALLPPNRQATAMLKRLARHAQALRDQGLWFGQARLAVGGARAPAGGCRACGMCLYGCPYDQIYSARATVEGLSATAAGFRYLPGHIVRRLVEADGRVEIHTVARDTGEPAVFVGRRALLAAGAYNSTRILLESMDAFARPVTLRQSEHFLLPLLLRGFGPKVSRDPQHTLAQVFLELIDPAVSPHKVHLQVYGWNDFYGRMAQERLGRAYRWVAPLLERGFEHLLLIKGYLHSDDSAGIGATLVRGESGPELALKPSPNPRSAPAIRGVLRVLHRNAARLGVLPLDFALRVGPPGSGVHVGGGFPMSRMPGDFETDLLGRPAGFSRVHCVDSTVFPTVPAPTVTLTVMANATRIAAVCAELDADARSVAPPMEELLARARQVTVRGVPAASPLDEAP